MHETLTEMCGKKVVGRAEMLASMDCLMHHLKDRYDFEQWRSNAMPQDLQWHVLDNEPGVSVKRFNEYVDVVTSMSDHGFDCVVRTFADIVRGQCFMTVFNPDAFSVDKETPA